MTLVVLKNLQYNTLILLSSLPFLSPLSAANGILPKQPTSPIPESSEGRSIHNVLPTRNQNQAAFLNLPPDLTFFGYNHIMLNSTATAPNGGPFERIYHPYTPTTDPTTLEAATHNSPTNQHSL
jgi:hypothetical protein